jgi:hypothetical protein
MCQIYPLSEVPGLLAALTTRKPGRAVNTDNPGLIDKKLPMPGRVHVHKKLSTPERASWTPSGLLDDLLLRQTPQRMSVLGSTPIMTPRTPTCPSFSVNGNGK